MKKEYIYLDTRQNLVQVLQAKPSNNSKLGKGVHILGTYHFSIDQVQNVDIKQDSSNCLDCPFSYNSGKGGTCYTHKGFQRLGLQSMLGRLNKLLPTLEPFNSNKFVSFVGEIAGKVQQVRFGVYGEPVTLSIQIVSSLYGLAPKHVTGYTHQWNKEKYRPYSTYFRASVHNQFEADICKDMGWMPFSSGPKIDGYILCPASKEAGRVTTCYTCALCSGSIGKGKKANIYIPQH